MKEQTNNPVPNFFLASAEDFKKIPGSPIAYWVSIQQFNSFFSFPKLKKFAIAYSGMSTTDNERFLRSWYECDHNKIGFKIRSFGDAITSRKKWFQYNKGGSYRKWYGNNELLVNYFNDGQELKEWVVNNPSDPKTTHWSRRLFNTEHFFKKGLTWSSLSSGSISFRFYDIGFMFDSKGPALLPINEKNNYSILGFVNSNTARAFLNVLCPTLDFNKGPIESLPTHPDINELNVKSNIEKCVTLSKLDWYSYESSWEFSSFPLLSPEYHKHTLKESYTKLRTHWKEMTFEMQRLEQENNRIFIKAYGLQDELTPDVPLEEITLTCNPHYRYNGNKTEKELEALLLADTMKEFISYAVGCMFGRYSLDKPGLILANQGETKEDYKKQVPIPTFEPDNDNVIPVLDGDWFIDDISDRFRRFLRVTFGDEHYEENLNFLEQAIGKDIRKYFLKDFYNHHIKMYKKRPIYWMFSSPNGSFNALIYMHRYRPDTISIVLNNYLREFRSKIAAKKENLEEISSSPSSSQSDKTKALKEIEKLKKVITELEEYERDVLYPLATKQVEIDLDDGVKVNYNKFGKALRKVAGLTGK